MASTSAAKKCSFLFLLTLLFSQQIQARDSQFFNKVSSTTPNDNVVPNKEQPFTNDQQQQEPSFLPENGNGYGLYGHESGQLPPSATTTKGEPAAATTTATSTYNPEFKEPQSKYLPKNYNPVAYVTEPEDMNESSSFAEETYTNDLNNNNNNYNNDDQNYYNNNQQRGGGEEEEEETSEPEYRRYSSTNNRYNNNQQRGGGEEEEDTSEPEYRRYSSTNNRYNNNNNYHYNGGSSFNSDPQGMSDTRFMGGARSNSHFYNGGEENKYFRPQGMSDTRFLENGKYFYDVDTEKYSHNHPYESLKGVRARNEYNDRNYYGNSENSIHGGYQNQYEFQDEESMP